MDGGKGIEMHMDAERQHTGDVDVEAKCNNI
jgi:hypothetical protein